MEKNSLDEQNSAVGFVEKFSSMVFASQNLCYKVKKILCNA